MKIAAKNILFTAGGRVPQAISPELVAKVVAELPEPLQRVDRALLILAFIRV